MGGRVHLFSSGFICLYIFFAKPFFTLVSIMLGDANYYT